MHFLTYDNWQIEEQFRNAETEQLFSSLEKVLACEGERIVKDKISEVVKLSSATKTFYVKRYTGSGRKYFGWLRKSRVRVESDNLISLTSMGLPVPNVIAYGERRKNGHFLMGALITEEAKNSANLARYLKDHTELLNDKEWLYSVIDQVAVHVHEMHKHRFIHRDLNLRNVLVQTKGSPKVYFIDCPAGGFKKGSALQRGRIRDLAHLDKVARYLLSDRDLLRFYKKYQKVDKLTAKDKLLISQIRHFHDQHRARQNRAPDKAYRTI